MHVIWFLSALHLFDVKVFGFCALQQKSQMSKSELVNSIVPYRERGYGIAAGQFSSPAVST